MTQITAHTTYHHSVQPTAGCQRTTYNVPQPWPCVPGVPLVHRLSPYGSPAPPTVRGGGGRVGQGVGSGGVYTYLRRCTPVCASNNNNS